MGLKANKGRKYKLDKIFARHFLATAKEVGFSTQRMQAILDEFANELPSAIEQVKRQLPEAFPAHVSTAIFEQSLLKASRLTDD
ncbi:hypothetical protein [Enterovibrio sp. 27052020O]|uniref:hypothetical protein n=1 Tax=Enterovibrio sp. 27052020O TaxID=3241166 RepID=UPI0038904891